MLDRREFLRLLALIFSDTDFFVASLDSYCSHTYLTIVITLKW